MGAGAGVRLRRMPPAGFLPGGGCYEQGFARDASGVGGGPLIYLLRILPLVGVTTHPYAWSACMLCYM